MNDSIGEIIREVPRVAFHTLGCRLNQYETESIREQFEARGFSVVPYSECADVYVVNTCTVTNQADTRARQALRRAIRRAPDALVVATGCYAQTQAQSLLEIDGVDLVLGNAEKSDLVDLVLEHKSSDGPQAFVTKRSEIKDFDDRLDVQTFENRTRATLKIQDGCDQFCSFCIIPWARGRHRSRPLDEIIKQAKNFLDAGYKEIVLSGVHLGGYGSDLEDNVTLTDVVSTLLLMSDLPRLRLSSIWPTDINPNLIALLKSESPRFCRYLHLAIQHGDDEILSAMKRAYTVGETSNLLDELTGLIPDICIGTDIMTGFPGETDAHFERMYAFLERAPLVYFHVFSYSRRSHTRAASMPDQVPPEVARERNRLLRELSDKKSEAYYARFQGKITDVLIEDINDSGRLIGRTDHFMKVELPGTENQINSILPLKIIETNPQGAFGIPAD